MPSRTPRAAACAQSGLRGLRSVEQERAARERRECQERVDRAREAEAVALVRGTRFRWDSTVYNRHQDVIRDSCQGGGWVNRGLYARRGNVVTRVDRFSKWKHAFHLDEPAVYHDMSRDRGGVRSSRCVLTRRGADRL